MNYINFRNQFFEAGCFSTHQIYAWYPDFDRNNLTRWVNRKLLVKLRQGFYAFPEYRDVPGFQWYLSNQMYKPSYISLHAALAFYDIIPEAVTQITAVGALKTIDFENDFGTYTYQQIRSELMFGYELKPFNSKTVLFAYPEKAILDLLYLYPFYNTPEEMEELRFDEYFMENELDMKKMMEYLRLFNVKALEKRVDLLLKVHDL
ncbi:MAG: hypothetical protein LBR08_04545 [Bacteroidales bacterium]|jgi:predicted transcriptional regulator of viral defense system|nr:hypothetical protein [Bacteroidales bacterium]